MSNKQKVLDFLQSQLIESKQDRDLEASEMIEALIQSLEIWGFSYCEDCEKMFKEDELKSQFWELSAGKVCPDCFDKSLVKIRSERPELYIMIGDELSYND